MTMFYRQRGHTLNIEQLVVRIANAARRPCTPIARTQRDLKFVVALSKQELRKINAHVTRP